MLGPYKAKELVLRLLTHFTEGQLGPRAGRDFSVSPSALEMKPELGGGTWGQLRTPGAGWVAPGMRPARLEHPVPSARSLEPVPALQGTVPPNFLDYLSPTQASHPG